MQQAVIGSSGPSMPKPANALSSILSSVQTATDRLAAITKQAQEMNEYLFGPEPTQSTSETEIAPPDCATSRIIRAIDELHATISSLECQIHRLGRL